MTERSVNLAEIFKAVTRSLEANQQALDQADSANQNHGSNMVQTFQTITSALEKKQKSTDSAALSYAAQSLAKSASSGSGQAYARNLSQAATQFKGKRVDAQGALQLLQTLIGSQSGGASPAAPTGGGDLLGALLGGAMGGQAQAEPPAQTQAAGGGDLLGALLGGMMGGQQETTQPAPSTGGGGDLLGALLGGLTGGSAGGQAAQQQSPGFDLQDLLAAGMAFMQAKQQGQGGLQALVQAFMAGSGMGSSLHRTQSTQIVVESFLQALSAMKRPA